jgi:hypothetical protein
MSGERDVEHELGRGLGEGHVGALLTDCTDCCVLIQNPWVGNSFVYI